MFMHYNNIKFCVFIVIMEKKPTIKHIVLAGGGTVGFTAYGVMRESAKSGFWHWDDIQTIFGTSIGGIMAIVYALKFDWDILDDFFIKRPWHHVFKMDMNNVFLSFQTKGILDIHTMDLFYEPLFKAKDLDMKITMKEFYEFTGIEVHLFATEFNETVPVDISWKTHPDWTVMEAVYCSCCLPFLFSPYFKDDKIYYDGGIFFNYPLIQCYNHMPEPNLEEIFGIKTNIIHKQTLQEDSTLFDYVTMLLQKFIESTYHKIHTEKKDPLVLPHEIVIDSANVSLYDIYLAVSNMDVRLRLIDQGASLWKNRV